MISLILMMACSSDVGLLGYVEKRQDTSEAVSDTGLEEDTSVGTDTSVADSPVVIEGIGGYVNYYLRQVACPQCVGELQELLVEFKTKFHEPITDSHTSWIPSSGTCTNQLLITVPTTNPVETGSSLTVTGPFHEFVADRVAPGEHYAYIYETQYDRNSSHSVSFNNNNADFMFTSIEGFDFIEPYTMLYVDPAYAFSAPILKSGMTFTWGPYGSSGVFMITIAVYNQAGSQLLGYAACVGPDQGYLTFQSQYLSGYPSGSLAVIHLARHKVDLVPYEPLGSYIETHMEWEVVGTGYLQ